ncbi:OmpW/AlkL family protein [Altericroceibacterium endophyticum]|uniref:Outer membrane beta-barrel protein n=1 Tax=Altericroceibacterium endophyticum TaxID=1808508 RepID=A0A6I4T2H4_9SPHN|nr:OmpW family outer membrane protein [Altericroceibacterium endophyticum]MXO65137.1 outer membrane beta-barrel protein [Altericroceibacterium endophyticum]
MRKTAAMAALAAAAVSFTAPAHAADSEGRLQIKVLGTYVMPDGDLSKVKVDEIGLPADLKTEANDNFVPTVAIEYFLADSISLETICCVTQHDVDVSSGSLEGAELVSDAKIIPATLTVKYHFAPDGAIRPYVGAGPSYFIFIDEKPGKAAVGLGADKFRMNDKFGVALQAGVDIPVGDNGMALTLDAKRYFLKSSAHWFANGEEVISTRHDIDPWLLSAGVAFRF